MWLSDVGDSFSGALKPLRLVDGLIQYPGNEAYMFKRRDDGSWIRRKAYRCSIMYYEDERMMR